VRTKDSCWSVGTIYDPRELLGVSTIGLEIGQGVTGGDGPEWLVHGGCVRAALAGDRALCFQSILRWPSTGENEGATRKDVRGTRRPIKAWARRGHVGRLTVRGGKCEHGLGELWHADHGRTRPSIASTPVLTRVVTCPSLLLPWPVQKTSSPPLKLPILCGGQGILSTETRDTGH
jgi:hypothetical protein